MLGGYTFEGNVNAGTGDLVERGNFHKDSAGVTPSSVSMGRNDFQGDLCVKGGNVKEGNFHYGNSANVKLDGGSFKGNAFVQGGVLKQGNFSGSATRF